MQDLVDESIDPRQQHPPLHPPDPPVEPEGLSGCEEVEQGVGLRAVPDGEAG